MKSARGILCVALLASGCRASVPDPGLDAFVLSPPVVEFPTERTAPAPVQAASVQFVSATEPVRTSGEQVPTGAAAVFLAQPPQRPVEIIPTTGPVQLTLTQTVETGLAQNPDLIALRGNEGVGQGVLGVARTYPFNPFIQVQATPYQQTPSGGPGTTYHYVLLMQNLQLAHQQRYRENSAAAALNSVRWNIHQAELLNMAQTERLYFTALYQRGILELVRANVELNEQLLRVLQRQFEAGQAAASDVAIVRIDSHSTRHQAQLAEANYQTALLDLRRQLNVPLNVPLEPQGDLTQWQWRPATADTLMLTPCLSASTVGSDPESVLANLAAGRPDVMAAQADLAVARSNSDLARASRMPDLQIGPYYQRTDTGITYAGFRAQTDIPVINNGVPLVRQREAEVRQRMGVYQQLQARARIEAQAAVDRFERARRLVAESGGDFREPLPVELRRLEEQFKAGEVDVLRVFTARTSLIQLRRAQLDLLNELAQAAANVTAATGLPPDALIAQPQPVR
jgi:cobalt-zinc-cadmium efflux system outer membrane protein